MERVLGEEIVVSSGSEDTENCRVWDPITGNLLSTFKGGNSISNGLTLIGDDYIVSAQVKAPLLRLWHWRKNDHTDRKIPLPGVPTALDVTSSGHICVMGISNKIYIWHISTGELLKVIDYHTSDIRCLKISKDGRYIVSTGTMETRVVVWNFLQAVDPNLMMLRPQYTFHDHNATISDIYISTLGYSTKIVSCGTDCSCFVYDLSNGKTIFKIFGDANFTSVTMDPCEFSLYLGTDDGNIYAVEFHKYVLLESVTVSKEETTFKWKKLHSGSITSLSLTSDSRYLLSGSKDGSVRVWEVSNAKNVTVQYHKGEVTNAFFAVASHSLISATHVEPNIVFSSLQKSVNSSDSAEKTVFVKCSTSSPPIVQIEEVSDKLINSVCYRDFYTDLQRQSAVEKELEESRIVNEQFYAFTMGTYMNSVLGAELIEPPE